MQYFKKWHPSYAPGTYRTYNNPGIGMLGVITAKAVGEDFTVLMEQRLFPALGMKSSFINVPAKLTAVCSAQSRLLIQATSKPE